MYKLRIYVSWMSEHVILLPVYTCIYVDTFIIYEYKKSCRLEKAWFIKRSFMSQLVVLFLMHI